MHTPDWHILDSSFPDADRGLALPPRNLSAGGATLRIENLDRADPPGYRSGGVPRSAAFNANVFRLSPSPCMPPIPVVCVVNGFVPSETPIEWRLVCRHVLCRHANTGGYRYRGASEVFEREWRGQSKLASFTLFSDPPECTCTYNEPGRILGGHALLMVAAALPGATLLDYVHLRITGTNPSPEDVLRYLEEQVAGYDPNVSAMLRAVFRHESNLTQFASAPQTSASMRFSKQHHSDPAQPECRVRFDWPDDPADFPLASFDFGVGISQWTRVGEQRVSADIAWDWRENIRIGANRLLSAVNRCAKPGRRWREVALAAWKSYNGSGPAAAAYAARLASTPDGASIVDQPVPGPTRVALLQPPPELGPASPWINV